MGFFGLGAGGGVREQLRLAEGRYHAFFEASPMGIHLYRLDADHRLIFTGANPAADRILGVDNGQFVGKEIGEAFPGLAGTEIPAHYRAVAESGEPWVCDHVDYEDGRVAGAYEVCAFRTGPRAMAALFLDVSERRRAERALRESEEKYRLLVENAGDGIFIAQDGNVVFANRRAADLVGRVDPADVMGHSFLDFIDPDDWDLVKERHARRVRGEQVPSNYQLRLRSKDGESFWTDLNTVLVTWEGRPGTLNFIRDISAQKKMEAQLYLAERMQSIGTLAGGIAHDFNNILMGIQGNVSLLLMQIGPEHPWHARVKSIERCVESGAELTAQILGFARGGRYQVAPTDMGALVRTSAQLFGRAKKEIALHVGGAANLWAAEVDRTQIEQVLLNLFVNAAQAMPGGGEIFVESFNATVGEEEARVLGLAAGRFVGVSVRDTGSGIDPAVAPRIFDPFFSTKDRSRGTGLGLASAYGIVRNHGGAIRVESTPGRGATFTVLLPATERLPAAPAGAPGAGRLRGEGLVLLVDDEPQVAAVAREMLQGLGYGVLAAASGTEALALYRANRADIVAVVLDMVMPGLTGGETFDRLREMDPGVRVLLSSGYSIDSEARNILERGCDDFIQKPYGLDALSQKLRGIIERR